MHVPARVVEKTFEFRMSDSPISSSEGFRIVWVRSWQKEDLDSDMRDKAIRNISETRISIPFVLYFLTQPGRSVILRKLRNMYKDLSQYGVDAIKQAFR